MEGQNNGLQITKRQLTKKRANKERADPQHFRCLSLNCTFHGTGAKQHKAGHICEIAWIKQKAIQWARRNGGKM